MPGPVAARLLGHHLLHDRAVGEPIAEELGWSRSFVYGGFSAALVVMGITSPLVGRLIDERGGRPVMVAGSCLSALGCLMMSLAQGPALYYSAWLVLGLAMRMCLYEAAFASLVRIAGPAAKRPISQITLLGGLASSAFWPIGHGLATVFGWRGALVCYAAIALATILLHLAIPDDRHARPEPRREGAPPPRVPGRILAGTLYVVSVTLVNFLASGMSAHIIGLLGGLGLATAAAVWISTLRGVGQSTARLCDVLFGGRLHPTTLNLIATAALPACFVAGPYGGLVPAAIAFAFLD
ncbi:MAG: MFS transporter, partial [Alphaproteobacteria bacterium]